jgi:hypothetical protein
VTDGSEEQLRRRQLGPVVFHMVAGALICGLGALFAQLID